jgi:hypothetical protein
MVTWWPFGGRMIFRATAPGYLAAIHALALLRLLLMGEREKAVEILVLRHQLLVLQRQVGRPVFTDVDRAVLAGLLHHLPGERLRRLRLLVRPDTILRGCSSFRVKVQWAGSVYESRQVTPQCAY